MKTINQVENGDFYAILKKLAAEKSIRVEEVILSPRTDSFVKKLALVLCLSLLELVVICFLRVVMRWQ